jgi:hypothetical protein
LDIAGDARGFNENMTQNMGISPEINGWVMLKKSLPETMINPIQYGSFNRKLYIQFWEK